MPTRVVLPVTSRYTGKDQAKSDKATKFIGRGSSRSSTAAYAKAWGDKANTSATWGYTEDDVVFVNAEGARSGRLPPDFTELQHAINAGCTFITDTPYHRARPYNLGEREVAQYLTLHGYKEHQPGVWTEK